MFPRVLLTAVFFLVSAPVWATPTTRPHRLTLQKMFFHLHQTVGHFESQLTSRCKKGKVRGIKHLQRLKGWKKVRFSHPFAPFLTTLQKWANNFSKARASGLEQIRLKIHEEADRYKLHHDVLWRREFWRCK